MYFYIAIYIFLYFHPVLEGNQEFVLDTPPFWSPKVITFAILFSPLLRIYLIYINYIKYKVVYICVHIHTHMDKRYCLNFYINFHIPICMCLDRKSVVYGKIVNLR